MKIKNIFVTGAIHSGKSTILKKVIEHFPNLSISGFLTRPVYEGNKKKGFTLESWDGSKNIFAHTELDAADQYDIYKFDHAVFEEFGVTILEKALIEGEIILMDEIGMMERQAAHFKQTIIDCLNAPQPVLGACQQRAIWFLALLKNRTDTIVFSISKNNRDLIPGNIISLLNLF